MAWRPDGMRAYKQNGSQTKRYFLYDGIRVICELNPAGSPTASYGYGPAGLVQRYEVASSLYTFYTFDPFGNPGERIGQSHTYPSDLAVYDACGALHKDKSISGVNYPVNDPISSFAMWGAYTDEETRTQTTAGLPLMTTRFYDPATLRFLTRDPMSYDAGANLYTYCGGDPVNNVDPMGVHRVIVVHDGAAVGRRPPSRSGRCPSPYVQGEGLG